MSDKKIPSTVGGKALELAHMDQIMLKFGHESIQSNKICLESSGILLVHI
jgi:hypothetical protein